MLSLKILRYLFIIVLYISEFASATAQDAYQETDTNNLRGFLAPVVNVNQVIEEYAVSMGGAGGIFITQNIFAGIFGSALISNHHLDKGEHAGKELDISYGGLWIGYAFRPGKKLQPIISLQGGLGVATLKTKTEELPYYNNFTKFTLISPLFELEYKITPFLRFSLGANYFFANGFYFP